MGTLSACSWAFCLLVVILFKNLLTLAWSEVSSTCKVPARYLDCRCNLRVLHALTAVLTLTHMITLQYPLSSNSRISASAFAVCTFLCADIPWTHSLPESHPLDFFCCR
ncbi:hypothetical protein DFH06DRAFT_1188368 [Mycena polygramma]|nr:hypothetical protein DFH06DRAFT_1188368 [Mycena polygramma]